MNLKKLYKINYTKHNLKIAHLILTHGSPLQLKRLLTKLLHTDAAVFIHVDLKTDIQEYLFFEAIPNVYLIKKRVFVNWGGYSIVQATVNLCKEVIGTGIAFDYVNLLSGQDYPIKSHEQIHQFLADNQGKAFMEFYSVTDVWQEAIPRLTQYHLTDFRFKGANKLERLINFILPERKMPNGLVPVGRSQWFTLPLEQVKYVVDYLTKNPAVKSFFSYTWGSDEIIFQTILFNSPFKDTMINNNLRYIDWSEKRASPKVLTMQDAGLLMQSDKLYARKFSLTVDSGILDYIDDQIS